MLQRISGNLFQVAMWQGVLLWPFERNTSLFRSPPTTQYHRWKFCNEGDVINFSVNERLVLAVTLFKQFFEQHRKLFSSVSYFATLSQPQLFHSLSHENYEKSIYQKSPLIGAAPLPFYCISNLMKHQIKLDTFQKISAVWGKLKKVENRLVDVQHNMNNMHGKLNYFMFAVEKYHREFIPLTSQKAHLC